MSHKMQPENEAVLFRLAQLARELGLCDCASREAMPQFLDQAVNWDSLEQALKTVPAVGLDTEFVRETTFVPGLALLQLSLPNDFQQYLVDTVHSARFGPLMDSLMAATPIKVMHGCSEDLEIFLHHKGAVPESIFDTQIAAALLGARRQTGYTGLVSGIFGVEVDKAETRSDWFQRPLSPDQIKYAARDVLFLLPLYQVLSEALKAVNRHTWLLDEMAQLKYNVMTSTPPELYYQKISNHWRLSPRGLYLLQQLCIWREQEARAQNLPRGFLVSDAALGEIAREFYTKHHQLRQIKALKPSQWRDHGQALFERIESIYAAMPSDAGQALAVVKPLPKLYQPLLKSMKALIAARAESLGIESSLLLGKRYLLEFFFLAREQFVEQGQISLEQMDQSPWLSGWRREEILAELVAPLSLGLAELGEGPA